MKNLNHEHITLMAKQLFNEERNIKRLDGWFISQEIKMKNEKKYMNMSREMRSASYLYDIASELPLFVSDNNLFVGTQRDAFAMSYSLINPAFTVESFSGYCDPTAVFNDIEPNEEFTKERISKCREWFSKTEYAKALSKAYAPVEQYTKEVAFFIEQVTGHTICNFDLALKEGLSYIEKLVNEKLRDNSLDSVQKETYNAMLKTISATLVLTERYRKIVETKLNDPSTSKDRKEELELMNETLKRVPKYGARNIYEAMQSYILLWQMMCLEQVPNPYAFSVGNVDRLMLPFYEKDRIDLELVSALFKHVLVFFNVGTRSWAISQNLLLSGKDNDGNDLTNELTYAFLDSYYDMNLPQPILSVKLHKNTPTRLYESLGRFFFTPGCLTPSFFNDDTLFDVLVKGGIEKSDVMNYAVAGCQEPLIMGKDNGNTTNSWLNLGKILELTINGGKSLLSNDVIGPDYSYFNVKNLDDCLKNIREAFYKNVDYYLDKMVSAANNCSRAIGLLPVPFLSMFMGGLDTGYDMRDTVHQGTKYNGSGCLIHGLSVVADSFIAIDNYLKQDKYSTEELLDALKSNFEGYDNLHKLLKSYPKYGNNIESVDVEASKIALKVSQMVKSKKNYLGNGFRADFSTPSTHLLYGYHFGATPDGRCAREMLGYGVDPLYGEATSGLGFRMLSTYKLPFIEFNGGYAMHLGVDPKYFTGKTFEEKGIEFKNKIFKTVFFSSEEELNPSYLYVNVTTAETLRAVLKNPKKYAPNGVYIMRIHGTFVNFLDLSPAIQEDIIKRLDNASSRLS